MAKASTKQHTKSTAKTKSAYSKKEEDGIMVSAANSSKYQPTENATMNVQSLGAQDGLQKLFEDSIKDLYWAENHLVKSLPKMINAASSKALSGAIQRHLKQTQVHVQRLEQVFETIGKKPKAKKCDAMEGLTKEGEGVIEETDMGTPARDLGIIMAAQKVEHYEISAYTGLTKLAEKLGLADAAELLSQTLAEEEESDQLLATIAENDISFADDEE